MFTMYRLAYFGVASAVVGAITLISAAVEPDEKLPPLNVGARSIEESKDKLAAPGSTSVDGKERGNLEEVGAREIFTMSDYSRALALSRKQPVLVFKHSTDCEVSGAAYRRMAEWLKAEGKSAPPVFLVKVIERRPVSQEIADRTHVKHESPQIILLDAAKPVWNADHEAITREAIDAALAARLPKETSH
jgi:bacillithiol system protein YtxJ